MRRDTFERLVIFLTAVALSVAFFATTFVVKKSNSGEKLQENIASIAVQQFSCFDC